VANLVLLCPVTRDGSTAMKHWEALITLINTSDIYALVVIDKTKDALAEKFFLGQKNVINSKLFILKRDPSEPIFDSQKFIQLDEMLWVQQLHDDDFWDGILGIPENALENQLFLTDFYSGSIDNWRRACEDDMPPARIVFSAVPAKVWNRFTEFIYFQGGHVAGSVDSTLSMVASYGCQSQRLSDFKYFYSDRHWAKVSEAKRHLKKISYEDGWGSLASPEIAVLNRTIDNLAALAFFQEFIDLSEIENLRLNLVHSLKPSLRKRARLTLHYFYVRYFNLPIATSFRKVGFPALDNTILELRKTLLLSRLLFSSWNIVELGHLLDFIRHEIPIQLVPKLRDRFDFWLDQIFKLENINS
jgi:hypothetical protein